MEDQSIARIKEIKKQLSSTQDELGKKALSLKPLRFSKSNIEKKMLAGLKNRPTHNILLKKILLKEELRRLLVSSSEVRDLPKEILNLSSLSTFECCHLLVHEKGKPVGQNYFFHKPNFEETKSISIQSFNSLYNLVKKSKNKNFNQSISLKDDLEVVGNFLAKDIDLKNYSVIYLVSRNSFLLPSQEEQEYFQGLSSQLQPLLMRILDKDKMDLQAEVLKQSLLSFPEKIIIKKNSAIVFSNQSQTTSSESSHLMMFPLDEYNDTVMELSNFNKESISTELYHSQRVSLLGELLNTLQHELSNPLFGLNLTSSILSNDRVDTETSELLREISHNAHRSQTIIKNFSNLYNDQQELKKISIYQFIEEVITLTKSETKEIQKNIECIGFVAHQEIEIQTNPTCLTQIIFNLIINSAQALKSLPGRRPGDTIKIKLILLNKSLTIAIEDNGPGVKPEFISAIFDPFFTTKESGTGLGLSICQNLARQLGSKIDFQNNSPFPGATFSINLPLA